MNPPDRGLALLKERAASTGWFRTILRAGLALGMLGQTFVLIDLNRFFQSSTIPPGRWIAGPGAVALGLSILGGAAWVAALLWGRTIKATVASGAGCVLAWSYYSTSDRWSYFAAQQHAVMYLVPLFPLLLVATVVTLRDSYAGFRAATLAALRMVEAAVKAAPELAQELQQRRWVIAAAYGVAAAVLLGHVFLLSSSRRIFEALNWGLRSKGGGWPYNFAWLPVIAGLALALAAMLHFAVPFAARAALSGSTVGCVYSTLALGKLTEIIEIDRSLPQSLRWTIWLDIRDWVLLGLSLIPVLFALFMAVRDSAKFESMRNVAMRVMASLCFAVFVASAHLDWNSRQDLVPICIFGIACGYLSYAWHPTALYEFAFGGSLGESAALALLGLALMGNSRSHGVELYSVAGSNILLFVSALASGYGGTDELRPMRVLLGFVIGLGAAAFALLSVLSLEFASWG